MRRSLRVLTPVCSAAFALHGATSCPSVCNSNMPGCDRAEAFKAEIAKIRVVEAAMRQRWVEDEEGWHRLPARAWPEFQPNVGDIPGLRRGVETECGAADAGGSRCATAKFDLATALLFNQVAPEEALALYRSLAERAEPDPAGMTALGMCLTEGYGIDKDYKLGSRWFVRAAALGFPQAVFEVGVLNYTGAAEPHLPEDTAEAFRHFERSAELQHTGGMFMTADLLMSGEAPPAATGSDSRDYARAVRLLHAAGNKGHRQARQYLLGLLRDEKKIILELERAGR
jgi:hypothetical protein